MSAPVIGPPREREVGAPTAFGCWLGCFALMAVRTNTWLPHTTGELQLRPATSIFRPRSPSRSTYREAWVVSRDARPVAAELRPVLGVRQLREEGEEQGDKRSHGVSHDRSALSSLAPKPIPHADTESSHVPGPSHHQPEQPQILSTDSCMRPASVRAATMSSARGRPMTTSRAR